MELEFEGIDELIHEIESIGKSAESAADEALLKGAEYLKEQVQSVVRVLTGNLKAHIEISEIKNGEIEVYVDNQGKAYYGYMLEFGTSKMRAQPFMFPAFQRSVSGINLILANTLRLKLGLAA